MDAEVLMEEARKARVNAYAPYSRFKVGAAILTQSKEIFAACNVENKSYGLSVCAERNAVAKAVSEGHTKFLAIAVSAYDEKVGKESDAPPCGACRQVLSQFDPKGEMLVHFREGGEVRSMLLSHLQPLAFTLREG